MPSGIRVQTSSATERMSGSLSTGEGTGWKVALIVARSSTSCRALHTNNTRVGIRGQSMRMHRKVCPDDARKPPGTCPGVFDVAPTGIDPVTFRFSVERSTN